MLRIFSGASKGIKVAEIAEALAVSIQVVTVVAKIATVVAVPVVEVTVKWQ